MRPVYAAALVAFVVFNPPQVAAALSPKHRAAVDRGLVWLKKQGVREGNGIYWGAANGEYAVSMTALAGMAFLMEGSTLKTGKYSNEIRGAANWLMARTQGNGLIGNPSVHKEGGRYMYGHGFGMLFLACLVGEEDTVRRREDLVKILERAAKYSRDAQTSTGGWGYVSSKENAHFDEGSVTITQVQALRAVRNAGLIVPGEAIKDALKYLKESTNSDGGIRYSLKMPHSSGSRPALTAAAIACGFNAGTYDSPLVKMWMGYCAKNIRQPGVEFIRDEHGEYTQYYFAQVMYVLGDDRHAKLFPDASSDKRLTWSKYRPWICDELVRTQQTAGNWESSNWTAQRAGTLYVTCVHLAILQLDRAMLPIYQR